MSDIKIKIAAGTNVGLIRQNNEDNFVVCPDLAASVWTIPQASDFADLGDLGALLIVADGMGGANAGEVASAIAIETLQELFTPDQLEAIVNDDKLIQDFMKEAVKAADINIYEHSQVDSSTLGMGTTVVIAWIYSHRAYVCWCGDSRCYVYRGSSNALERISKDHSYVQELVDRGELDPEFASDHPLSNVITRCLGDSEKRAEPDTRICELHNGDTILLCSDGLCGLCDDSQIAEAITQFATSPMTLKDELISAALSAGGHDNVTVAICCIQREEEEEEDVLSNIADESQETKATNDDNDDDTSTEELSATQPCATAIPQNRHLWVWLLLFTTLATAVAWAINTFYYKFI